MSQRIPPEDLTGLTAGATGTMDWSGLGLPTANARALPHLQLFNESGCGLDIRLNGSGRTFTLPAGGWVVSGVELQPNDTNLSYTVLYVIPNAPVSTLIGVYWGAGEPVANVGLGNSPIGLSGSVATTNTQVINDGNAGNTVFVEGTVVNNAGGSNVSIDNSGDMFLAEWYLGATYNKMFQVFAGTGSGGSNVLLGLPHSVRQTYTEVQGNFKVDGTSSLDAGTITTDGAGNLTAGQLVSNGVFYFGAGSNINTTPANQSAAFVSTLVNSTVLTSPLSGTAGGILLSAWSGAAKVNIASFYGQIGTAPFWIGTSGQVAGVSGVATAGLYGVPLVVGVTKDLNITTTTLTNVLTYTTPNDGVNHDVEVNADLFVGAANTNTGTVTLQVVYTDPHQGALTLAFNVYGQANLISGITQAKGQGIRTDPRAIRCTPNSAVTVQYHNTAAGGISDFSSALVKLMS